jgi:AcrR family transcriptional regulator
MKLTPPHAARFGGTEDREAGLRERKKQRTRQALIEAAIRLYREAGYEGVTVAALARGADIAPRTFFTYFRSKEDVFLGRGDDRIEVIIKAIQGRQPGTPILTAVMPALLANRERPAGRSPELSDVLQHPSVMARLRERWNSWEDGLAQAIADDVGAAAGDPEPRIVAAALTGAIRVASAVAQEHPGKAKQAARRAFELLATGLSTYGAEGRAGAIGR